MKKTFSAHGGLIFLGVAVLVHGLIYWRAQAPGEWIYSTREGVPARTSRTSGVIEFAGINGWHPYGAVSSGRQ